MHHPELKCHMYTCGITHAFSSHGVEGPWRGWWSAVDELVVFLWIPTHILIAVAQWPCVCVWRVPL